MDIREYWDAVKAEYSALPQDPTMYITSLDTRRGTRAGRVSHVARDRAARWIVEKTHRLSTPEETDAYRRGQEESQKQITEEEYRRKQQFALPDELRALVELAVSANLSRGKKGKGDE